MRCRDISDARTEQASAFCTAPAYPPTSACRIPLPRPGRFTPAPPSLPRPSPPCSVLPGRFPKTEAPGPVPRLPGHFERNIGIYREQGISASRQNDRIDANTFRPERSVRRHRTPCRPSRLSAHVHAVRHFGIRQGNGFPSFSPLSVSESFLLSSAKIYQRLYQQFVGRTMDVMKKQERKETGNNKAS